MSKHIYLLLSILTKPYIQCFKQSDIHWCFISFYVCYDYVIQGLPSRGNCRVSEAARSPSTCLPSLSLGRQGQIITLNPDSPFFFTPDLYHFDLQPHAIYLIVCQCLILMYICLLGSCSESLTESFVIP